MKVLVAGSTGVLGTPLVPALTAAGHEVVGTSRRKPSAPSAPGVKHLVVDALDRRAVTEAVRAERPDAIVNVLTAIPGRLEPRRMAAQFQLTDRLRTEGTRYLNEAGAEFGVQRIIAQGLAFAYDPRGGDGPASEDAPFWPNPPKQFAGPLSALVELERLTAESAGLVLRFGHLYGPGTAYAPGGSYDEQVRAGKFPLVSGGRSVFSFTHVSDAADAVVAALASDVTGALNIVDDEPAPMSEWLPVYAERMGGPPPGRAPALIARLLAGGWGLAFMTRLRGADNARAKQVLPWQPAHATWRDHLGRPEAAARAAK